MKTPIFLKCWFLPGGIIFITTVVLIKSKIGAASTIEPRQTENVIFVLDSFPTVVPLNYTLRVRPVLDDDDFDNFEINSAPAEIFISVKALQNGNKIELNQKDLSIDWSEVEVTNLDAGKPLIISRHVTNSSTSTYVIELEDYFKAGERLEIYIPFVLKISSGKVLRSEENTPPSGFLLGNYTEVNGKESRFAVTQLGPYRVREVFPLFDNPNLKTKFVIIVGRWEWRMSLSNMEKSFTEKDPDHDGLEWDFYKETPPLSPHQIFILVAEFANYSVHIPTWNRTVMTWGSKSFVETGLAAYTTVTATRLIDYYGIIFKMDYPSAKMDIVRIPNKNFFTGSTESFGCIVMPSGLNNIWKGSVKYLADKLSQQWLGIVVSSLYPSGKFRYNELLNRGLASYVRHWGIQRILKKLPMEDSFDVQSFADTSWHTVLGSVLQMMEDFFGAPVMKTAVSIYLRNLKWKIAIDNNLWDAMEEALHVHQLSDRLLPSGVTVKEILYDWISRPSYEYPIVRVTREEGAITFSQERFDWFHNVDPDRVSSNNSRWWIPITLGTEKGEIVDKLWLPKMATSIAYSRHTSNELSVDNQSLVMINPFGTARYRTLYDSTLTLSLVQRLLTDHQSIPSSGRVQLIDDYIFFGVKDYISIESALEMTRYLGDETSGRVWVTVLDNLLSELYFYFKDGGDVYKDLQRYFAPKLEVMVERVRPEMVDAETWRSLQKWCLQLEVPACVEYASVLMEKWQRRPDMKQSAVFPLTERFPVSLWICAALSTEDEAEAEAKWNFLLEKVLTITNSTDIPEKHMELVWGLSCSKSLLHITDLLLRTLGLSNTSQLQIFTVLASSREIQTKWLLYDFAKATVLSKEISVEVFQQIISQLRVTSRESPGLKEDLRHFMDVNSDLLKETLPGLEISMILLNSCKECDWWDKIGSRAHTWLSQN